MLRQLRRDIGTEPPNANGHEYRPERCCTRPTDREHVRPGRDLVVIGHAELSTDVCLPFGFTLPQIGSRDVEGRKTLHIGEITVNRWRRVDPLNAQRRQHIDVGFVAARIASARHAYRTRRAGRAFSCWQALGETVSSTGLLERLTCGHLERTVPFDLDACGELELEFAPGLPRYLNW